MKYLIKSLKDHLNFTRIKIYLFFFKVDILMLNIEQEIKKTKKEILDLKTELDEKKERVATN
jgi:hypothetical protein